MSRRRFATHPLQLALGLAIWLAWFALAYGGLSLGCALAQPPLAAGADTWINKSVGVFTLATVALLVWFAWLCVRAMRDAEGRVEPKRRFIPILGAAVHIVGVIGTVFVGVPLVLLPPCL